MRVHPCVCFNVFEVLTVSCMCMQDEVLREDIEFSRIKTVERCVPSKCVRA